jgi:Bacterial Ig-like domain (group 3)
MPRSATQHGRRCPHADRMQRFRFAALAAGLAFVIGGFAYFPAKITAASNSATKASALKNPDSPGIRYTGSPDLVRALKSGAAQPTALVAADFDLDGAPDLVIGYNISAGGVIVLLRGNPDAFAPKDENLYQAAIRGEIPPAFLSVATIFRVPESPDFLATGDFNRDGSEDLLVGKRGGGLYLLNGDGHGNLQAPEPVSVPGQVAALATTSAGHIAVGTDGPGGPRLVVFAPSHSGLISAASYTLPAPATSVAWGALGGGTGTDLAVSSGTSVVVIYSALSPQAQRAIINFRFRVEALTLGDFIWDRNSTTEMAVLGGDGLVRILRHGKLETRPFTTTDLPARQSMTFRPTAASRWTVIKRLGFVVSPSSGNATSMLHYRRLAVSPPNDLMILDAAQNQISIFDASRKASSPQATIQLSGAPIGVYKTPQKLDGGRDLVVLTAAQVEPVILPSGKAAIVNVNTTTDTDQQNACTNNSIMPKDLHGSISLRTAVCAADNYGATGRVTINVPAGTYQLTSLDTGELQVGLVPGSNISIIGTGSAANTIIQQTDGMDRVLNFDPNMVGNVTGAVSNVSVTGGNATSLGGGGMLAGFIGDSYTVTNTVLTNNTSSGTGASGGGIDLRGGSLSIANCTITNNTANVNVGGGIAITSGTGSRGNVSLINTVVSGNTATGNGSFSGRGGGVFIDIDPSSSAIISGSTVVLNTATGSPGQGGGIFNQAGPLSVINSRIVANQAEDASGIYTLGSDAMAADNWWGCNDGPGTSGCDTVDGSGGTVTVNPWLVLSISASPTQIKPDAASALTADLTHDSGGSGGFSVPTGTSVTFSGTLGSVQPSQTILTNGIAASTYTAGPDPGAGQATATVDNQPVSATIDIVQAPAILNINHTTFRVGKAGTFQITTVGFPPPAITENGSLPNDVTFEDNGNGTGTLAGLPAVGTGGSYKLAFTAQNSVPPNAQQNFTLTIREAPAITSAERTNFRVGTAGSFTVTTTGFPTPSITQTGALPNGVKFVDNHDGTGTLAGTPGADTAGEYPIIFGAANGVFPRAIQHFRLQVGQTPAITSADNANFQVGTADSFTVTTTGFPTARITQTGELPNGVGFVDNRDGTGTLSGISTLAGTFTAELSATNIAGIDKQNFTLTVQKAASSTVLGSSTNPSGLNDSVLFSARVSSNGTGTPTGEVNILDGATALGSLSLDGSGEAKLSVASLTTGTHSITAAYLGDHNYASSTSPVLRQVVMGAPQFSLTVNPSSLTLPTGVPAGFTITATGQNGFNGAVSLACTSSTLPAGATCQFSPPSITPGASPSNSALIIITKASTSAQATPSFSRRQLGPLFAIWLVMPTLLVSRVGLSDSRRKKTLGCCLVLVLIAGCLWQSACSSGMAAGNEGSTSAGTFHIVVTGTSGSITQTAAITLTLN